MLLFTKVFLELEWLANTEFVLLIKKQSFLVIITKVLDLHLR